MEVLISILVSTVVDAIKAALAEKDYDEAIRITDKLSAVLPTAQAMAAKLKLVEAIEAQRDADAGLK